MLPSRFERETPREMRGLKFEDDPIDLPIFGASLALAIATALLAAVVLAMLVFN